MCKLDMMMLLARQEWQARLNVADTSFHTFDADKFFHRKLDRSKWYFLCLLNSSNVLDKLPLAKNTFPVLWHALSESYYKTLMLCNDASKRADLVRLCDSRSKVTDICDQEFAAILDAGKCEPPLPHVRSPSPLRLTDV